MKLSHPISTEKTPLYKILEKYRDRKVYLYHSRFKLWWESPDKWNIKSQRMELRFSAAIGLINHYPASAGIEYHFIDQFGDSTAKITDFDDESIYNCTSITFDKRQEENDTSGNSSKT